MVVLDEVFEAVLGKSREIVEKVCWKSEKTEHRAPSSSVRPKMEKSDIMEYSGVFKRTLKNRIKHDSVFKNVVRKKKNMWF